MGGAKRRAATLYSVGPSAGPDHEAADALRQRSSETADPFSVRHADHALTRAPPPRIGIGTVPRIASRCRSSSGYETDRGLSCRLEHDTLGHTATAL